MADDSVTTAATLDVGNNYGAILGAMVRRDTCLCGEPRGHAGWLNCAEAEYQRATEELDRG